MAEEPEPVATPALSGTYVFDHRRSRQGYKLNKMCMSLTKAENRERFLADERAYLSEFGIDEHHIDLVRRRDWLGMVQSGGNIYMLIKLGHLIGEGLYVAGAQQRGETLEQFLATRGAKDAR